MSKSRGGVSLKVVISNCSHVEVHTEWLFLLAHSGRLLTTWTSGACPPGPAPAPAPCTMRRSILRPHIEKLDLSTPDAERFHGSLRLHSQSPGPHLAPEAASPTGPLSKRQLPSSVWSNQKSWIKPWLLSFPHILLWTELFPPKKRHVDLLTAVPQNVILFRNRITVDVIS